MEQKGDSKNSPPVHGEEEFIEIEFGSSSSRVSVTDWEAFINVNAIKNSPPVHKEEEFIDIESGSSSSSVSVTDWPAIIALNASTNDRSCSAHNNNINSNDQISTSSDSISPANSRHVGGLKRVIRAPKPPCSPKRPYRALVTAIENLKPVPKHDLAKYLREPPNCKFTIEGDTFGSAVRASTPTPSAIDGGNGKQSSPPPPQHLPVHSIETSGSQLPIIRQVKVKLAKLSAQSLTPKGTNLASLQQPRFPRSKPFSQPQQPQQQLHTEQDQQKPLHTIQEESFHNEQCQLSKLARSAQLSALDCPLQKQMPSHATKPLSPPGRMDVSVKDLDGTPGQRWTHHLEEQQQQILSQQQQQLELAPSGSHSSSSAVPPQQPQTQSSQPLVQPVPRIRAPPVSAKIPPILVRQGDNVQPFLCSLMSAPNPISLSAFSIAEDGTRIQCGDMESHARVLEMLLEHNIASHTYQPPGNKGFRVLIKRLPASTPSSQIRAELANLGFSTRFIEVLKHRITRVPFDLFEVELANCSGGDTERVLGLTELCGQQISVERLVGRTDPVQCHRCQLFGHSKNYCRRPFKCLKCAGGHPTTECNKARNTPGKCANCGEGHIASYKGCSVYKNERAKLRSVRPNHTHSVTKQAKLFEGNSQNQHQHKQPKQQQQQQSKQQHAPPASQPTAQSRQSYSQQQQQHGESRSQTSRLASTKARLPRRSSATQAKPPTKQQRLKQDDQHQQQQMRASSRREYQQLQQQQTPRRHQNQQRGSQQQQLRPPRQHQHTYHQQQQQTPLQQMQRQQQQRPANTTQELQLISSAIAKLNDLVKNLSSLINDRLNSANKQPANDNLHDELK